ncbi:MAG: 4Fe-4S dicluster domain-containing protein [Gammaproteobacteria bacterium]|nr:4Fe-4S dicluster domain-containing protein [Gammaproteobacteria bacterium]
MTAPANPKRRALLAAASTSAAAAAVAPGLRLIEWATAAASNATDAQPVTDETRWGLLIDTDKCAVDCDACVRACNAEHGLAVTDRPETDPQWIRKVTLTGDGDGDNGDGDGDNDAGRVTSLPLLCQHCEHPPCVDVCPTGASFRRADGIVLVDKHTCIGCRYCVIACPYQARAFVHENLFEQKPWSPRGKGTVEGCTLCVHRIDQARAPACVEACNRGDGDSDSDGNNTVADANNAGDGDNPGNPADNCGAGALLFGDLNDPQSAIAGRLRAAPARQLRADLNLNTGVRYQNL